MRNVLAIALKETKNYFVSSIAYIVIGLFLVMAGFRFYVQVYYASRGAFAGQEGADLVMVFGFLAITLLFFTPLVTMRQFAEERKSGTIELLMTAPVTELEVTLGKFAAVMGILLIMLLLTLQFPLLLERYGEPDWGPILSGYIGLLLLGSVYMAFGLMTSSLTSNQIVAAAAAFFGLLFSWMLSWVGEGEQWWRKAMNSISLITHYDDFAKGVVDTQHVVYYLSVVIFCLYVTVRVLQSGRWK